MHPTKRVPHLSRAAFAATLAALLSVPLGAHDAHVVGPYRFEIGWGDEPAFTGIRNAVVVEITDARTGAPVEDLGGGSLTVELVFGMERTTLPLHPASEHRNELRAWLVPTRAGTYTFHITGAVKSQPIDITSTCSDKTFDCVVSVAEIQFPAKDPSTGQLAERIERSQPRIERTTEVSTRAQTLAYLALGVSAFAAVSALVMGMRRRKGA